MAFEPFNLGRVMQDAEAIKGFQRRSKLQDLQEISMREGIETQRSDRNLRERQFDAETQRRNTEKLLAGVRIAKRNPEMLPDLVNELASDGVLDPNSAPQLIQTAQADPNNFRSVLDDLEGKLMFSLGESPAQPKVPSSVQEFQFAQENPELEDQFFEFLRNKQQSVTVNTGASKTPEQITSETAASERGKAAVTLRGEIRETAKQARNQKNQVARFRQVAVNTETGAFQPKINVVRSFAKELGIDVDEKALAAGEGIQALAVPFTLQIAQQTKGPISDREMQLFGTAVAGLSRSPRGNELILEFMERIAERNIDIDRLATEYVREKGLLDAGWDAFISDWETQNPLFDEGETSLLQQASGAAPGQAGAVDTATGGVIDFADFEKRGR